MAIDFKKQQYTMIYAAVGAAVMLLVFKAVIGPFHQRLALASKQVMLQEAKLKKGMFLIDNQEAIKNEYGKYASYFSMQNSSNEEAVAEFLREIEKISRSSGILIVDVKPQKDAESDAISKQFQINIKAEATMKELVTFFYGLYTSPLLFSIEKMTLVPKSEGASELSVTLTLMGVSFV